MQDKGLGLSRCCGKSHSFAIQLMQPDMCCAFAEINEQIGFELGAQPIVRKSCSLHAFPIWESSLSLQVGTECLSQPLPGAGPALRRWVGDAGEGVRAPRKAVLPSLT